MIAPLPPDRLADLALALYAWEGQATPAERLAVLSDDVRGLLRGLARAETRAADLERVHHDRLRGTYLALVDVVDAFERVFAHIDTSLDGADAPDWVGNFRTVARLLRNVLAERGVTQLDDDSTHFDPTVHTVAATVAGRRADDGLVAQRLRPGYRWGEHVLRKAEVVVVDRHAAREDTA